jgi:hypothetical protein
MFPATFAPKWSGKSVTRYPGKFASKLKSKFAEMSNASNARSNVPTLTLVRSARSKTMENMESQPPRPWELTVLL